MDWRLFSIGCVWVVASFVSFRALQFLVRWYLFGRCTFPTFSYFRWKRKRRNRQQSHDAVPQDQEAPQGLQPNGQQQQQRGNQQTTDSTSLTLVPPNKKWRICNEVVSLIHSAVSGVWALYALMAYPGLIDDMIGFRCLFADNLLLLTAGYLAHDLLDLLINERSARIIELLFHHVVVLTAFATSIVSQRFLGVVVFGLLMELNSIFLHSRSLLNLYGVQKRAPSFRIVALLNVVSLLLFRIAVSLYLLYWLVLHIWGMHWLAVIPSILVIVSLSVVNFTLGYRVMAADGMLGKRRAAHRRRSQGNAASAAEAGAVNNAENEGQNGPAGDDEDEDDNEDDDQGEEEEEDPPTQPTRT